MAGLIIKQSLCYDQQENWKSNKLTKLIFYVGYFYHTYGNFTHAL